MIIVENEAVSIWKKWKILLNVTTSHSLQHKVFLCTKLEALISKTKIYKGTGYFDSNSKLSKQTSDKFTSN